MSNTTFDKEADAFEQLRPTLMEQYAGQYVAIYQGAVIASGNDSFKLLQQVHERYGPIACYIDLVEEKPIRIVRIVSMWKVRS